MECGSFVGSLIRQAQTQTFNVPKLKCEFAATLFDFSKQPGDADSNSDAR